MFNIFKVLIDFLVSTLYIQIKDFFYLARKRVPVDGLLGVITGYIIITNRRPLVPFSSLSFVVKFKAIVERIKALVVDHTNFIFIKERQKYNSYDEYFEEDDSVYWNALKNNIIKDSKKNTNLFELIKNIVIIIWLNICIFIMYLKVIIRGNISLIFVLVINLIILMQYLPKNYMYILALIMVYILLKKLFTSETIEYKLIYFKNKIFKIIYLKHLLAILLIFMPLAFVIYSLTTENNMFTIIKIIFIWLFYQIILGTLLAFWDEKISNYVLVYVPERLHMRHIYMKIDTYKIQSWLSPSFVYDMNFALIVPIFMYWFLGLRRYLRLGTSINILGIFDYISPDLFALSLIIVIGYRYWLISKPLQFVLYIKEFIMHKFKKIMYSLYLYLLVHIKNFDNILLILAKINNIITLPLSGSAELYCRDTFLPATLRKIDLYSKEIMWLLITIFIISELILTGGILNKSLYVLFFYPILRVILWPILDTHYFSMVGLMFDIHYADYLYLKYHKPRAPYSFWAQFDVNHTEFWADKDFKPQLKLSDGYIASLCDFYDFNGEKSERYHYNRNMPNHSYSRRLYKKKAKLFLRLKFAFKENMDMPYNYKFINENS